MRKKPTPKPSNVKRPKAPPAPPAPGNKKVRVKVGTKDGKIVSSSELARLWGTTQKTIKNYISEGMPAKEKAGVGYNLDTSECLRWRIEKEHNEARLLYQVDLSPDEMSHNEAKRRTAIVQLQAAELDLAEKRKKLVQHDELILNFAIALTPVRAKINSQAARLSGELAHQDQDEITKILIKDAEDTLTSLVDYSHDYIKVEK